MASRTEDRPGGLSPQILVRNDVAIFFESLITLAIVWYLVGIAFDIQDTISGPALVFAEILELWTTGEWIPHFVASLRRVVYGYFLTLGVGTVLGVVMGMSNFWEHALKDYITIGLALPSLFAAIFSAMWFGVSDTTPMVAGAAIAFPFLTQDVYKGVQNIDRELLEMSSSFGVSRNRTIRRVILQSILPQWFAGSRYAFAICWKITTLAEVIAASNGIGFMLEFEYQALSLTGVFAWVGLFTVFMLFLEYGVLRQIEKRVFDWREGTEIGVLGGA